MHDGKIRAMKLHVILALFSMRRISGISYVVCRVRETEGSGWGGRHYRPRDAFSSSTAVNIFVLSYVEHKAEQPGQSSQQRKEAQDDADEVGPDAGKAGALCP